LHRLYQLHLPRRLFVYAGVRKARVIVVLESHNMRVLLQETNMTSQPPTVGVRFGMHRRAAIYSIQYSDTVD